MAENSKIQWTHHAFNPWRGCTKVSPGCAHCYAETLANRNPAVLGVWGDAGTRVVASEAQWEQPLKWDREAKAAGERRRVFCASLADVFEDWSGPMVDSKGQALRYCPFTGRWGTWDKVEPADQPLYPVTMDQIRGKLFSLIHATPNLDWLLLTKRPENVMPILGRIKDRGEGVDRSLASFLPQMRNVWIGTTVENQEQAAYRLDTLCDIPATVRFVSAEPLLEAVDLSLWLRHIDWVICGGESGSKARRFEIDWARSLRGQCDEVGTAFFMKQFGSNSWTSPKPTTLNSKITLASGIVLRDSHGGDPSEWPEDLRVREMPDAAKAVAR